MPDFSDLFERYIENACCDELIKDKECFRYFQKCRYSYIGKTDVENIAEKAAAYQSSLIIINSRKCARETYNILSGKKYHLSTYMTPYDRSETIKCIRNDLRNGEKITVVSTSLVEAGVDLDFHAVFRQLAGLDSILQSGGRCNREGKLQSGDVFIFETDDKLRGDMKIRAGIVKDIIGSGTDIVSEKSIRDYYKRLFAYSDQLIEKNTISADFNGFDSIPFRTYAENFEFIRDDTLGIVINNSAETDELLTKLKFGGKNIKRKLQRYSVSLKMHGEFDKALKSGLVTDNGCGIFVLANNDYYKTETGLDLDYEPDYIYGGD